MYFTIRTSDVGLADQLRQLEKLHALGTALGYRYLHTPLADSCHNYRGEILDDFLGLGIGELRCAQSPGGDDQLVDVDFAAILPGASITQDIDATRRALTAVYGESPDTVYRFCYRWRQRQKLVAAHKLSFRFPFFTKYWQRRSQQPMASPFRDAPLKIAVHIRKGDRAHLVYKGRHACNGRFIDEHDPAHPHVPVSAYRSLIERLFDRFSAEKVSFYVFSDGYQAAFNRLSRLATSSADREELLSLRAHHERELLALGSLPGVRLVVAEDEESMCAAIHACATCDLLIRDVGAFSRDCFHRFNRRPRARVFTLPQQQLPLLAYCGSLLGMGADPAAAAFPVARPRSMLQRPGPR
jgi:hypothetical protein